MLHFICLGKYPDKSAIKFLKNDLKSNKDSKIVIFFHYNLTGKWSDWWSEKERFYNVIKDYNIKAILVEHAHISRTSEWKDYLVVSAGSKKIAKCTYNISEDKIEVEYI